MMKKNNSKKCLVLLMASMLLVFGSVFCFANTAQAGQNAIGSEQDGQKIVLKKGSTKRLSVTIGGSKIKGSMVKFKSSNTKVAKVSKTGKVTAIKKGTAKITYYPKDYPWAKFSCKIVVKSAKK